MQAPTVPCYPPSGCCPPPPSPADSPADHLRERPGGSTPAPRCSLDPDAKTEPQKMSQRRRGRSDTQHWPMIGAPRLHPQTATNWRVANSSPRRQKPEMNLSPGWAPSEGCRGGVACPSLASGGGRRILGVPQLADPLPSAPRGILPSSMCAHASPLYKDPRKTRKVEGEASPSTERWPPPCPEAPLHGSLPVRDFSGLVAFHGACDCGQ